MDNLEIIIKKGNEWKGMELYIRREFLDGILSHFYTTSRIETKNIDWIVCKEKKEEVFLMSEL